MAAASKARMDLTPRCVAAFNGKVCALVDGASVTNGNKTLQTDRAPPDLDDTSRDADLAVRRDLQPQAARPAARFALVDGELLRQRRTGGQEPSSEVGARRAGAGIFDH